MVRFVKKKGHQISSGIRLTVGDIHVFTRSVSCLNKAKLRTIEEDSSTSSCVTRCLTTSFSTMSGSQMKSSIYIIVTPRVQSLMYAAHAFDYGWAVSRL